MTNKEILSNAPEGATHWDFNEYLLYSPNSAWSRVYDKDTKEWLNTCAIEEDIRSLADIKRIVELENALENLLDATNDFDSYDPDLAIAERSAREVLKEA